MSKETENKALATAEGDIREAAVASFLGKFDMSMEFTPENVQLVTKRFKIVSQMHEAMSEICIVDHGMGFIWLKAKMKHGEWTEYLKTNCPGIPLRTIQWWMAEARYVMDHGHRRANAQVALLGAQGVAHFAEGDGDDLDADDLADPSKPAPLPRQELENRLGRLETRLSARDRREEKLLEQVASLENRLREERQRKDPDGQDERTPIKTALNRALLALGRALVLLDEAEAQGKRIAADCPPLVLATVTSQLKTKADRLAEFTGRKVLAYAKEHNEEKRRQEVEGKGPAKKAGGSAATN